MDFDQGAGLNQPVPLQSGEKPLKRPGFIRPSDTRNSCAPCPNVAAGRVPCNKVTYFGLGELWNMAG